MKRFSEKLPDGRMVLRSDNYASVFNTRYGSFIEGEAIDKLGDYEDLDEQGKLVKLPCKIGETVYVLAECGKIPQQLDGTLYNSDGSFGTATGYYCPYEDSCPFDGEDFEGCEKYQNQTAIFEDTVSSITIDECGVYVTTEYCGICSEIGEFVFLTKEEAEVALQEMDESEEPNET